MQNVTNFESCSKNIHVKIQCDNEFRRFVLGEVTYNNLAGMIRTLLGFAPEANFKLSYLDDEGDWVLFATDSELHYACTLSKSPLKISVKVSTPPHFAHCHKSCTEDEAPFASCEKPWKVRGGRGGRGGCRGRMMRGEGFAERIDAKLNRLNERHAMLSTKLIENELPEERARALEWRLSHLQNKIDTLKAKKQQLSDVSAVQKEHQETPKDDVPATPSETATEEEPHPRFGGRGRRGGCRGGRGGWRREGCGEEQEHGEKKKCFGQIQFACSTPEGKAAFERVQAAKEAVHTARQEKADKEVIHAKWEALKEAKADWREVKLALWKEKRLAEGACPKKESK